MSNSRRSQLSYAVPHGGKLFCFFQSSGQMRTCTDGPYRKVRIVADPYGDYFTWHDYEQDMFNFTHPVRAGVDICFPYGSRTEEDRGRGKLIRCRIEDLGEADPNEKCVVEQEPT